MRYDKLVLFITESTEYNPDTGRHEGSTLKVGKWVAVSNMTATQTLQIYGRHNISAIEIHYKGKAVEARQLEYDNKRYSITATTGLRNKVIQYATEV